MGNPNKKRSTDPEIPQAKPEDENSEETSPPLSDPTHDGSTSRRPVPIALSNSIPDEDPRKKRSTSRDQAHIPFQADRRNVHGHYINPLARTFNRPRTNLEPHQSPSVEYHNRNLYGPHVDPYFNQIAAYQRTLQMRPMEGNHTITNPDQFSNTFDQRRGQERAIPIYNGYNLPLNLEEHPRNLFGPHGNHNQNEGRQNNYLYPQFTNPNQLSGNFWHSRGQGSYEAPNPNHLTFEEYHRNQYFFQTNQNLDQTSQTYDIYTRGPDSQLQTTIQSRNHIVTRPDQSPGVSGFNRDQFTLEQFRRNQLNAQINQYFKQSEIMMIQRKRKSDKNIIPFPDKLSDTNGQTRRAVIEALRKNRTQFYRPYVNPYLNQNPNGQSSHGPTRTQENNTFTERRNANQPIDNPFRMFTNVHSSYYRERRDLSVSGTSIFTTMVNENHQIVTQTENPDSNVSTSIELSNGVESKSNVPDKKDSVLNDGNSIIEQPSTSGLELQSEEKNNPKTSNDMEQKVQLKEELINTVHEPKLEVETVPEIKIEDVPVKNSPNKKTTSTGDVKEDVHLINNILSPKLGRLSLDQNSTKNKKKKKASDNPAKKLKKAEDNSSLKVTKKQSDESNTEKLMCKIALKDCPKIISLLQSKMRENKRDAVKIDDGNVEPVPVSEVKETKKQEKTKRKERKEKRNLDKKDKTRVEKDEREFNEDLSVVQNVINEEDVSDAVINEVRSIDPVTGKLQSCYFFIQKGNSDVKKEKNVEKDSVECPITDPQHPYNVDKEKKPMETDESLAIPGCSYIIKGTGENIIKGTGEKSVTKKVFVITQVSNFHPTTGELESCYYYFKEDNDVQTIKEQKKEGDGTSIKKEKENGSDVEEVGDINQVVQACYCEFAAEEAAQLPSKAKKKKKTTDN